MDLFVAKTTKPSFVSAMSAIKKGDAFVLFAYSNSLITK